MTKKKLYLKNLEECWGIVTQACLKTGIARRTHYNWLAADPKFAAEVKKIKDVKDDYVESKFLENIKNLDTASIIFYLKTQCRHRGYSEKIDLDHSGGIDLNITRRVIDGAAEGNQSGDM